MCRRKPPWRCARARTRRWCRAGCTVASPGGCGWVISGSGARSERAADRCLQPSLRAAGPHTAGRGACQGSRSGLDWPGDRFVPYLPRRVSPGHRDTRTGHGGNGQRHSRRWAAWRRIHGTRRVLRPGGMDPRGECGHLGLASGLRAGLPDGEVPRRRIPVVSRAPRDLVCGEAGAGPAGGRRADPAGRPGLLPPRPAQRPRQSEDGRVLH
jgi:hypothetical protein